MLFLQLFLSFSVIYLSHARTEAEIKDWMLMKGIECSSDYPITVEEMTMLQQHKMPDSKNAKCLVACVYKKIEWLDKKGMFDTENAKAIAEKDHAGDADKIEKSKKLFDTCKSVNDEAVEDGDSGCDRAALISKCLIENATKLGFEVATA